MKRECYQYAYTCAHFINSIRSGLERFDTPVTINSNKNISDYLNEIDVKNAKFMNSTFRNCMMHPSLADKNGNSMISSSKLDRQKPLFGLVETCFDGMGYKDLKDSVVLEMKRISNILSQWLEIQSLSIKPL